MRLSRSVLALAGCLLLLAGCSSGTSDQVNVNADGSMQVETNDGTVVTGGMAVPADWASDVPVYADANVQYTAAVNPVDGKPGQALVFTSSDSAQLVVEFYRSALTDNGWTVDASMAGPAGTVMSGTKDNRTVSMLIAEVDGTTNVTIGIETHTN